MTAPARRGGGRPGVMLLVYTMGPLLFWFGLLGLVTLLAFFAPGTGPGVAPVAVLAGVVPAAVSLDLPTVGAPCIGLALLSVRRGQ